MTRTYFADRSNNNSTADNYESIRYLYLKATEGTGFVDSTYLSRHAKARQQGVPHIGAYHFAGNGSPTAEADHFLSVIGKPGTGALKPCLDIESGQSAAWVAAFAERVKEKLGYYPALYGNTSTIPPLQRASVTVAKLPWWRAEYGPDDGQPHPLSGGTMGCAAHQYTQNAVIPGLVGHADASEMLTESRMLVAPSIYLLVETGRGERFVYPKGTGWRVKACAKALRLLRLGRRNISITLHKA